MYYYDGTNWADFSTYTKWNSAQDIVKTARIIIPFKNRLLLLNTIEQDIAPTVTNTAHTNRCRYSHNGSPLAANAWLEPNTSYGGNNADGAGYIDAPTEEEIISAAIIKDRLIVYFERSTWELVYTHNEALPFVWQSINSTLGSEATFSTVSFDKNILTVGTTGIHSCNGANVQRIDEEIPDKIFEILKTTDGTRRVHGIKDYFTEMVYWSLKQNSTDDLNDFPDKILAYNYRNGTWSLFDDCFTAFGYFEQSTDLTWDAATFEWQASEEAWNDFYLQSNSRTVIAGNQQGFIHRLNSSRAINAPGIQITDMTYDAASDTINIKAIDHNLLEGDYVKINYVTSINYGTTDIFRIEERTDSDNVKISLSDGTGAGTYEGGGLLTRVSQINIKSKDWNPYLKQGHNVNLNSIDFNVDKTASGEINVNYSTSSSNLDMIDEAQDTGCILGTNVLETSSYTTLEDSQERLWHKVYFQGEGNSVNILIRHDHYQMLDEDIVESNFVLYGAILYTNRVLGEAF